MLKRFLLLVALCAVPLAYAAHAAAPVVLGTTELGHGPTIVILHALGSARAQWLPVARKLLADHRVVLVDLPGHGDSPMPDPFSIDAIAAAFDAVLAKQPADSTVVVGHGLGGTVALVEVHAHPERARGVVLIDTGLKFPMPIADQQKKMFLGWMDENFDGFLKQVYSKQGRDSAQGVEIHAQAALVPRENMKQYYHMMLDLDATNALVKFPRPLLYIGSELGWPANKDWAALAKERGLEGAGAIDTLRIEASAQLIMKDQPDSLAAAISAFAARVLAK
jgi:pimeloyl-ACP methyl ester carboxylesterase